MIFEKFVISAFKGMMYTRCDDTKTVFYYAPEDFEGLQCEPFSFFSSLGHSLKGYFYHYGEASTDRLIVFDHGFGGGHRAYMKEIERLCRAGYTVFAYDHTGCMESGGESPNGMAQSLCDLSDCITALRADARFASTDISVMGHSWGGFAALNICALHPDISHIVVLSGFVSVKELIHPFFGGPLKLYRGAVLALEKQSNPRFSEFHAVSSLSDTDAKVLLIYSDNDTLCRVSHYNILKDALGGKENIRFHLESGKGHNPNYTKDAVQKLAAFGKARAKIAKKKNLTEKEAKAFTSSFDWDAITAQDEAVWEKILAHLKDQ